MAEKTKTWILALGVIIMIVCNHFVDDCEWCALIGETMIVAYFAIYFWEERKHKTAKRTSIYLITLAVAIIWIYDVILTLTTLFA